MEQTWVNVLASALVVAAVTGLGYRFYRWRNNGPIGDVWGQTFLALVLAGLAVAVVQEIAWARWAAVAFGASFAIVVMPLWVLAVLIPLPPGPVDVAFTATYWLLLATIVVAGVAA